MRFRVSGTLWVLCWQLVDLSVGFVMFLERRKNLAALLDKDAYEILTEEAAQVEPGGEGLIFCPSNRRKDASCRSLCSRSVFGLTLKHRKNEIVRAVMEGVTFGMRDSFEIIREMGIPIGEVMAIGGGAKSPLWRKIQADIYQVPLYQVRVDEGPAFGAALLAAVGKGVFPNVEQACQKAVKVMDKVYPDSQKGIRYNEIYQIYKDLYPALKPFYKRISNISW